MTVRTITKRALAGFLGMLVLGGCGGPAADDESGPPGEPAATAEPGPAAEPDLADKLAAGSRPAADRERDAGRRPVEVVEFLGIEPGMAVLDVIAAGGYYTEVLSIAVGAEGRVVAQNPDAVLRMRDGANDKALTERLADDRLPNVTRLDKDFQQMGAADGQFDVAITALNFHDVYNGAGPDAARRVLETLHGMLVDGGVLGIIDHAGSADGDNVALHRIDKQRVVESAEAAGFVVEAESDLLANPDDDRTQNVFAGDLRGRTDRFLLKLRKPAGSGG